MLIRVAPQIQYVTIELSGTPSSTLDVGGDRLDELFAVLSNARRRFVVQSLQRAGRAMSVSELTTDVVSWEADMTDTGNASDERSPVEVALVHTHLPKLAAAGLVTYDDEAGTVTLTDWDHELIAHLDAVETPAAGDD